MNVGVVGNLRYKDLKAVLDQLTAGAASRGFSFFAEPSLAAVWDVPSLEGVPLTFVLTLATSLTVAIAVGTAIGLAQRLVQRGTPPADWSPPER